MDLVPTSPESLPGIDLPLLEIIPYDFLGFSNFPSRHGFPSPAFIIEEKSPEKLATLLQSWLYFGLLAEFFIGSITIEELLHFATDSSRPGTIRSRPFLDYALQKHRSDSGWKREHRFLEAAVHVLEIFEQNALSRTPCFPVAEVEVSVRILIHTLAEYCNWQFVKGFSTHPLNVKRLGDAGCCRSQIKQVERLHNEVVAYYLSCLPWPNPNELDHDRCPDTHCIASNVHGGRYKNRHICNISARRRDVLDAENASTLSEPPLEPCPLVQVDDQEVRRIIDRGGIPLVSISRPELGKIKLHVRPAKSRDCYVAISHVWSDGLGNPYSNALPQCQLVRLKNYIENLPHPSMKHRRGDFRPVHSFGSVSIDIARLAFSLRKTSRTTLFWMDTLCIPVGDDKKTQELKSRAINQMAFIYGRASQVLVLDSTLQMFEMKKISKSEVLARINYCAWMGRCWTYQEGSLTPFVYFQFKDGAVNPTASFPEALAGEGDDGTEDIMKETKLIGFWEAVSKFSFRDRFNIHIRSFRKIKQTPYTCQNLLGINIYQSMKDVHARSMHIFSLSEDTMLFCGSLQLRKDSSQWVQHLVAVWNALSSRSTTKAEDIPAIFANLLGFHSYQVMKYPPDERFKSMLWSTGVLPMSLLYNTGPRLQRGGSRRMDRWVPTTLGRDRIYELPLMFFDADRNLILDRKRGMLDPFAPNVVILRETLSKHSTFAIIMGGDWWEVTCVRSQWDVTGDTSEEYRHSCLLFHLSTGEGVALLIPNPKDQKQETFKALYDCPIRAIRLCPASPTSTPPDLPIYDLYQLDSTSWHITILNDTTSSPTPLPRISRATTTASMFGPRESMSWIHIYLSISIPLLILVLISTILRVYIASLLGWSALTALGRASLITFVFQRIPGPAVFLPVSQILFIIDRHRAHAITAIDIAYLVLDMVWIIYLVFIVPFIVRQWVSYRFRTQLNVWDERPKAGIDIETWWTRFRARLPKWIDRLFGMIGKLDGWQGTAESDFAASQLFQRS
ncbi:hypothetical protein K469DRAFT_756403 [Zopfia rhizophila CBS 207.26]|uniref:Heterokaryon incompatibility domain-containing protein n=1 Tax=Zopfia rhizophila CBS 207.26 TaxID=1314779 RepID=A0A6A6DA93_9PEZI|nr:hypothetical protein K469DRAFT_756403 [Zopfia rhizophila CBS 207.26]